MCAENIFVDELSRTVSQDHDNDFSEGIELSEGAEWFGKNHAVRLCGRDQK